MSNSDMIAPAYYVKVEGRIRGPYSTQVLASMLARGRVDPLTEVSIDRYVWFALERIGGPFAAGAASQVSPPTADQAWSTPGSTALMAPPPAAVPGPPGGEMIVPPAIQGQCFYSIDGVEHGPVPFPVLQQRANSGMLSPHDPVWVEGQPNWGPAGTLPGLTFVGRKSRWGGWVSQHPALAVCLSLSILLLLVGPIAFVFAKAGYERRQQAAELAKLEKIAEGLKEEAEAIEKKYQEQREESDRRRQESLDRQERLHETVLKLQQQSDLLDERIHQSKLQNLRDERTQRQFDAINAQINEVKTAQAQAAAEAKAAADRHELLEQQRNAELQRIHDEQVRHNQRVEDAINR
ncbi:MAG: GYF domain-containing protein [Pirellulales bacterium]